MSKLIRFDDEHFGYLVDTDITAEMAHRMSEMFTAEWPGKRLLIMQADEFIDLTGKYEIVPVADETASPRVPLPAAI